jgi:hypothetical protein
MAPRKSLVTERTDWIASLYLADFALCIEEPRKILSRLGARRGDGRWR